MANKTGPQDTEMTFASKGEANHPKYREVYDVLLSAIRKGEFTAGGKLPTEAELMQRFNFSRITIVRALRDLQTVGVVKRKRGSGTFVTEPERPKFTGIGLIFPPLEPGSIFATVHQALQRDAQKRNWQLLYYEISEDASIDQARAIVNALSQNQVKGLFYLPLPIHFKCDQINELIASDCMKRKAPLVLLDRDIHKLYDRSPFDLVGSDNELGGFLVGKHLLDRGCRRIVFFNDESEHSTSEARLQGVSKAMRSNPDAVLQVFSGDGDDRPKLRQIISSFNPDGIACVNDMTAAKVLRSLLAEGIPIPQRIKLTGFDDTATAGLLSVPLTTVRQSPEAMAFHAAAMMQHRIDQPNIPAATLAIACSLVIRASTQE